MKITWTIYLPALLATLMACGSDTATNSEPVAEPSPLFAVGNDSLGIDLKTDTVWVYWQGQELVFDGTEQHPMDSLVISYRISSTNDWTTYTTMPLNDFPRKFRLSHNEDYSIDIDYQFTLKLSSGMIWVGDKAFAVLTQRPLEPSTPGASSSSSVSSSSSASFDYTITSKTWNGEYITPTVAGSYELTLQANQNFIESRTESSTTGNCDEYHGTWTQNGLTLTLIPSKLYRVAKSDGLCPGYPGVGTDLTSNPVQYSIYFLDSSGDNINLGVPGFEPMILQAP